MNKTLHKELTKKSYYQPHTPIIAGPLKEDVILSDLVQEMKSYLKEAAQDLLQPRPEAIAQLLNKARSLR
jgi:hypothetical protein